MSPIAAILISLAAGIPAINDPGAAPVSASGSAEIVAPHPSAARNDLSTNLLPAASSALANLGTRAIGSATTANGAAVNANVAAVDGAEPKHGFPVSSMIPLLGFGLCGAAALVFARKKNQASPKLLEIVETHGLGGRRSLIVARICGETLLLGSSEAGLTLILARPGETAAQSAPAMLTRAAAPAIHAAANALQANAATSKPGIAGALKNSWLGRLRLANNSDSAGDDLDEPSFESLLERDAQSRIQSRSRAPSPDLEPALLRQPLDPLAESAEDQELRQKLANGRSGRIA